MSKGLNHLKSRSTVLKEKIGEYSRKIRKLACNVYVLEKTLDRKTSNGFINDARGNQNYLEWGMEIDTLRRRLKVLRYEKKHLIVRREMLCLRYNAIITHLIHGEE